MRLWHGEFLLLHFLGVKYGRYHNLAAVFKGAVLESELDNLKMLLKSAFSNMDNMKQSAIKYGEDVLKSSDKIAKIICATCKDK